MNVWSEYFQGVPDPRRPSFRLQHLLSDILGLALCAMLCGADDFVEMELFARSRQSFLQEKLGFMLPGGVPSHDTFTRVFARLNPQVLEQCLLGWLKSWQEEEGGEEEEDSGRDWPRHLSLDGKVARGSFEHQTNVCALSTVSVFASELRLMLGCARHKGPGGESRLVPCLLELLDLEGAVVTGDAAYCHKEVASFITDKGGDYVVALKGNHTRLLRQVQQAFEGREGETGEGNQSLLVAEQGHGRQEERRVQCVKADELGLPPQVVAQWPGLQSVVQVQRTRTLHSGPKAGHTSRSVWFYLSSLAPEAELLATTIRDHWSIENQAHWVLDVVFAEDRCRTRREHAPYNLALLRRICLNLLRQNQGNNSLKATRKEVTWNQLLLVQILHTPIALA